MTVHKALASCCPATDFRGGQFQATPDFKGIKTAACAALNECAPSFQATPDFKGIKTLSFFAILFQRIGFRPPLISKGLRPEFQLLPPVVDVFQATPDFKGIKTHAYTR